MARSALHDGVDVPAGRVRGCGDEVAATAPPAPTPTLPAAVAVAIDERTYQPEEVEVGAGGTITWSNDDTLLHSVAFDDDRDKGWVRAGETFARTFTSAGTYPYRCVIHPVSMAGMVTVA